MYVPLRRIVLMTLWLLEVNIYTFWFRTVGSATMSITLCVHIPMCLYITGSFLQGETLAREVL